jgi:transcriptional regulator with XRE-family HTH domain
MAIWAHFQGPAVLAGKDRARRRTLQLEAHGALPSGTGTAVQVHNISASGLLLESEVALDVGEALLIDLPHVGSTAARVVWRSGGLSGCEFEIPLSRAALSAAELRSAIAGELADDQALPESAQPTVAEPAVPDESFGLRLQRLRKERGLTQAQVATELGVSKPTVWAWEQGRARPVESRIDALAEVLGVDRASLLAGPDLSALSELLARSREQIAAAFGTSPDNVRIMIEL